MILSKNASYRHFLVTITARACQCSHQSKSDGPFKSVEKAIQIADGYWSLYLGFFGDQIVWLEFRVVDTRDGRVVWVNGRRTEGSSSDAF